MKHNPPKTGSSSGVAREKQIYPGLYGVELVEGTSEGIELFRAAILAMDLGDIKGARALYNQVLAREPNNAQAYVGLGSCALHEKAWELARQAYRHALDIDSQSALAYVGLGTVHFHVRQYRESAEAYERALRVRETLADAHWGAAVAYEMLGEDGKMCAHASRVLELVTDVPDSALASAAARMVAAQRHFVQRLLFRLRRARA